jgi:hypothetical protein
LKTALPKPLFTAHLLTPCSNSKYGGKSVICWGHESLQDI